LLEQDNTNYIRGLIDKTGLRGDSNIIENMAFVVSRATGNNPRKPKTILNHFVARFNLARNFPPCWKIARERPDWFLVYCIMESESFGFYVSDQIAPSKRMTENVGLELSPTAFAGSVRPILDEISVETWRTFQFLKKPNVHDLIPRFNEMVQFALERNVEKFTEIFFDLLPKYSHLVNILWTERKDYPSRMAFAERILWAYESSKSFQISTQIQNEIATMIQSSVTGWTHLPPNSTYELIIKPRHDCLNSVLGSFRTTNFDMTKSSTGFLRTFLFHVMRDFAKAGEYQNEIQQVLELRALTDIEITRLGLKYPRYKSNSVLQRSLDLVLRADSNIQPRQIVQYLQGISENDAAFSSAWLQTKIPNEITMSFQQFQTRNERQRLAAIEFCYELILGLEKNIFGENNQKIQCEAVLFRALSNQYQICRQNNFWEGIYFILSCNIELREGCSNQTLKQEAAQHSANTTQNFLATAPDHLVIKMLKQHAPFFENYNAQILLQAIGRSPNLVKLGFGNFPKIRSDIVSQLVRSHPDWLEEVASEFKENKTIAEEFGRLLVNYAAGNPNELLYATLGQLGCDGEDFSKALENHFSSRINSPNAKTIAQLESILRTMDLASYSLTKPQKIALRKVWEEIPIEHLTEAQQKLFRKFFTSNKTEKQKGKE
jgi:hypothetical protein